MEPLGQIRALIDMTEDDNSEFTNCMIEDILHNLGARIDTRYNANITHLIWQDGKNEKNLKKCLNSSNIHVVSPLWVVECQQANEKVEENAWPADIAQPIETIPQVAANDGKSDQENKPESENSESRTPSKKRKVTGAKIKSPRQKTILLSGDDDDDDDHVGSLENEDHAASTNLITPKRKSPGIRGRPKKSNEGARDKNRKVQAESHKHDENASPSANVALDNLDRTDATPKKSPGSKKKIKASSLCLSQLSDFVRDAAYDLAKNHAEFVIFENCDAKYVVVEKPVRTIKVFYALAKGNWVISAEWILASVTAGKWLNPEDFEFKDLPSKKSREARSNPRFKGLFYGERIFVRKGVEPGQAILQELFLICGAQIAPDEESASIVVVAQEESGGVSAKWLLDSLIVFEKLDPEGYLNAPVASDI